jgi:hypothetical protein
MRTTWAALILVVITVICIPIKADANSGDFSGGVAIGTSYAGVNTAPTNGMIVQGNVGIGTSTINGALNIAAPNSTTNATVYGIYETGAMSASSTGSSYGAYINPTYSATSGTLADAYGVQIIPQNVSTGTVTNLFGLYSIPEKAGTGPVTAMFGLYTRCYNGNATGAVTSCYDIYLDAPTATGVITNTYGIYQADNGSTNYFAGNVGIANTSPSHLLHVGSSSASGIVMELQNSSGACTYNPGASSVTVSCSSDMRLKTDIQDSKGALAWVDDMRVRDFTVRATGERKRGVVAQEVMLKHPEMVHENTEGTYLVDEPNPWNLVKAIQEQQVRIDNQDAEIDRLNRAIARLAQKK